MHGLYELGYGDASWKWDSVPGNALADCQLSTVPIPHAVVTSADRTCNFSRFASIGVARIARGYRVFLRISGDVAELSECIPT
jgi:hypothetical protein